MLSFGDFKKNEIAELIGNKDPLGLTTDINVNINNSHIAIERYMTIKTNMDDEAILPKQKYGAQCNSSKTQYLSVLYKTLPIREDNKPQQ